MFTVNTLTLLHVHAFDPGIPASARATFISSQTEPSNDTAPLPGKVAEVDYLQNQPGKRGRFVAAVRIVSTGSVGLVGWEGGKPICDSCDEHRHCAHAKALQRHVSDAPRKPYNSACTQRDSHFLVGNPLLD